MTAPRPIATLLTPHGRGGIAVIRLDGHAATEVLHTVFRAAGGWPGVGGLARGHIVDGDEPVDEVLVAQGDGWLEIHTHGGPLVVHRVLELLTAHSAQLGGEGSAESLTPCYPGGRNGAIGREVLEALPLASSELVLSLLSAQWSRGISSLAGEALARCRQAAAGDGDAAELRIAAAALPAMQRLLTPAEVVLAGAPNAGKSSLANVLVGRDVSIAHPAAGTTRDWVRELALLDGVPAWVTDSAGVLDDASLAAATDIDRQAHSRSLELCARADVVVLLQPGGAVALSPDAYWLPPGRTLRVASKCDIHPPPQGLPAVSAATGQGLSELKAAIVEMLGVGELVRGNRRQPAAFTPRQAALLLEAADAIDRRDLAAALAALDSLLGEA